MDKKLWNKIFRENSLQKEGGQAKNYTPKGGTGKKIKWTVYLNNGKKKTVTADSRKSAENFIGTDDKIIGIKKIVKV